MRIMAEASATSEGSVPSEASVPSTPRRYSIVCEVCSSTLINPTFHWTAIPLRFQILVKMIRIVAETARAQ